MRVAVIGSRDFDNYPMLCDHLSRISMTVMVSGGASGADSLGERYADERGIEKLIFPAEWDKYGKAAGHIRNTDIVKNSDIVIAFWDGISKGTKGSIDKCIKLGIPCKIIFPDGSVRIEGVGTLK